MIKIYGTENSRAMRPIWTAEEMGLDYELIMMPFPCLLYTSPSPRDRTRSRMPSSA